MFEKIKARDNIGMICAVLSAILFGFMPMFAKFAYQYGFNSFTVVFFRFLFGAVFIGLIILLSPGMKFRVGKKQLGLYVILSIFQASTPICSYAAFNFLSSGQVSTLHFTYPFFVMLITVVFFKTKITLKQIICAVLCLGGMILFYRHDSASETVGIILAIVSGLLYSIYIVLLGKFGSKDVPGFVNIFWIYLFSAAEIGIFNLATSNFTFVDNWQGWVFTGALGIEAVLAAVLFLKGVFLAGDVKTSLLSTFEPITSTIVGFAVFSEEFTVPVIIGTVLIVLSVILMFIPVSFHRGKDDKKTAD